jgi:hypothetical protein
MNDVDDRECWIFCFCFVIIPINYHHDVECCLGTRKDIIIIQRSCIILYVQIFVEVLVFCFLLCTDEQPDGKRRHIRD